MSADARRAMRLSLPPISVHHPHENLDAFFDRFSAALSEAEVNANHWLSRVGKCAGRAESFSDGGRFVEVAAVLQAQTDMRQQAPVSARTIDEDCLCGGAAGGAAVDRRVK